MSLEWLAALGNIPFAILVAAWLMFRMEKRLAELCAHQVDELRMLRQIRDALKEKGPLAL